METNGKQYHSRALLKPDTAAWEKHTTHPRALLNCAISAQESTLGKWLELKAHKSLPINYTGL